MSGMFNYQSQSNRSSGGADQQIAPAANAGAQNLTNNSNGATQELAKESLSSGSASTAGRGSAQAAIAAAAALTLATNSNANANSALTNSTPQGGPPPTTEMVRAQANSTAQTNLIPAQQFQVVNIPVAAPSTTNAPAQPTAQSVALSTNNGVATEPSQKGAEQLSSLNQARLNYEAARMQAQPNQDPKVTQAWIELRKAELLEQQKNQLHYEATLLQRHHEYQELQKAEAARQQANHEAYIRSRQAQEERNAETRARLQQEREYKQLSDKIGWLPAWGVGALKGRK